MLDQRISNNLINRLINIFFALALILSSGMSIWRLTKHEEVSIRIPELRINARAKNIVD